jgi:hypothetical protein
MFRQTSAADLSTQTVLIELIEEIPHVDAHA